MSLAVPVSHLISCVAWIHLSRSDRGHLSQVIPGRSPYGSWDPGRCLRCAVVGNSGNLRGAGYGATIDMHNYIMRWDTVAETGCIGCGDRGQDGSQIRRTLSLEVNIMRHPYNITSSPREADNRCVILVLYLISLVNSGHCFLWCHHRALYVQRSCVSHTDTHAERHKSSCLDLVAFMQQRWITEPDCCQQCMCVFVCICACLYVCEMKPLQQRLLCRVCVC